MTTSFVHICALRLVVIGIAVVTDVVTTAGTETEIAVATLTEVETEAVMGAGKFSCS